MSQEVPVRFLAFLTVLGVSLAIPLIAVFRTAESGGAGGNIRLLDYLWPGFLLKNQEVRLLDIDPSPAPAELGSLLVWSDHAGGSFDVDGKPAGQVPVRVVLKPGSHEILLDLPEGEKAGAQIHVRSG